MVNKGGNSWPNIIKKINEQGAFIRTSIYILSGFSIVLVGYDIGRLFGLIAF
jgi:hypothetical protein